MGTRLKNIPYMLRELSAWIDLYEPNASRDNEARLWGRIAKVGEEFGEVIAAYIGATDQNPRKGITHSLDDVTKELLDVALAALCAVESLGGNTGDSMVLLESHIAIVYVRAGLAAKAL